jgi:hypothetical protein
MLSFLFQIAHTPCTTDEGESDVSKSPILDIIIAASSALTPESETKVLRKRNPRA